MIEVRQVMFTKEMPKTDEEANNLKIYIKLISKSQWITKYDRP